MQVINILAEISDLVLPKRTKEPNQSARAKYLANYRGVKLFKQETVNACDVYTCARGSICFVPQSKYLTEKLEAEDFVVVLQLKITLVLAIT